MRILNLLGESKLLKSEITLVKRDWLLSRFSRWEEDRLIITYRTLVSTVLMVPIVTLPTVRYRNSNIFMWLSTKETPIVSLRLFILYLYFSIAWIGAACHSFYLVINTFIELLYLFQVVQNILFQNLVNIRSTMTVTIKLNKQLVFCVYNASTQVYFLSTLWMIKSTAVLICTRDCYPNICSTLIAGILSLFSVHLVNVLNHSFFNVVLKLRMPKTTRKMNKRSLWFILPFFNFYFKTLSFCNG